MRGGDLEETKREVLEEGEMCASGLGGVRDLGNWAHST
jgi:hypothetical protein